MSSHPLDFPLLADENIYPDVVSQLKEIGYDIVSVAELGLAGASDTALLAYSIANQRAILTHDSDFGTLAIRQGVAAFGIIYLRPGHIKPNFTLESIAVLMKQSLAIQPPFIIVVQRSGDQIRIRSREL